MSETLVQIFVISLGAGVAGSLLAVVIGYFSRDERLRVETSAGIGFLVGAAIGATISVFASLSGKL
jgi:ABC-type Mn2+/Zn2+ transport system permease subunit